MLSRNVGWEWVDSSVREARACRLDRRVESLTFPVIRGVTAELWTPRGPGYVDGSGTRSLAFVRGAFLQHG